MKTVADISKEISPEVEELSSGGYRVKVTHIGGEYKEVLNTSKGFRILTSFQRMRG